MLHLKLSKQTIFHTSISDWFNNSATQSKNAVSTNIKHNRYIHLMSNFSSIHFHTKRLYVHIIDTVDTLFSYGRGLIVCSSLQGILQDKRKYCACDLKCRYCIFTCGVELVKCSFWPLGRQLCAIFVCVWKSVFATCDSLSLIAKLK